MQSEGYSKRTDYRLNLKVLQEEYVEYDEHDLVLHSIDGKASQAYMTLICACAY